MRGRTAVTVPAGSATRATVQLASAVAAPRGSARPGPKDGYRLKVTVRGPRRPRQVDAGRRPLRVAVVRAGHHARAGIAAAHEGQRERPARRELQHARDDPPGAASADITPETVVVWPLRRRCTLSATKPKVVSPVMTEPDDPSRRVTSRLLPTR